MDVLHRLAEELLEKETVMGKELDELIVALRPGIKLHTHEPEDPEPQAASEPT
jgi:cell division protease FtsH